MEANHLLRDFIISVNAMANKLQRNIHALPQNSHILLQNRLLASANLKSVVKVLIYLLFTRQWAN